jgi:Domain of unknown function (DUF4283)
MDPGPILIQFHLQKLFPMPNWQWVARFMGNHSYLIESPNDEWCRRPLGKARLILDDIILPFESIDPSNFDKGKDLIPVWIQVLGLPYHLWQDFEFHRIADEIGSIVNKQDNVS